MKENKKRGAAILMLWLMNTALAFAANPVIQSPYTADPAALVYNDTFYLYTGHDEAAAGGTSYVMRDWHVFSSKDMVNWTDHGACLSVSTFSWAKADAWAGQCVYRDGKFYWYVPLSHRTINGFAIGVAVSTSPTGPFTDARGSALITNNMTTDQSITWDDIDPSVFIDDNGQAYLYWGNTSCKYAKLKSNMTELDGGITVVNLPNFTEAPWLHKRNGIYYLSYAALFPEYIDYATSSSPTGPWTHRGRLNELVPNCGTNHQAILEFRGVWYFVYHNGSLPGGGDYRRSVCIDYLYYNSDGTIPKIVQTSTGVNASYPTTGPTATRTNTRTATQAASRGDVNGSGTIDIVDALMIAQYSVGLNPGGFIQANADVNCNSTIDIIDALMTAQYYVGLLPALNC